MDKQETKNNLFMAAADLFATKGYHQVSVREICNAARVSKPVLYYYFKDKEDLLESLVVEVHDRIDQLFQEHVRSDLSFEKNLDGLYKVYLRFAEDYPYLIRLSTLVQFSPLPKKIKVMSRERTNEFMKNLVSVFQNAKKEGKFSKDVNIEMLTISLIAPLGTIVAQSVLFNDIKTPLHLGLKKYFDFWKSQFFNNPSAE
jgi:AcrR family transcriptional regulator